MSHPESESFKKPFWSNKLKNNKSVVNFEYKFLNNKKSRSGQIFIFLNFDLKVGFQKWHFWKNPKNPKLQPEAMDFRKSYSDQKLRPFKFYKLRYLLQTSSQEICPSGQVQKYTSTIKNLPFSNGNYTMIPEVTEVGTTFKRKSVILFTYVQKLKPVDPILPLLYPVEMCFYILKKGHKKFV